MKVRLRNYVSVLSNIIEWYINRIYSNRRHAFNRNPKIMLFLRVVESAVSRLLCLVNIDARWRKSSV